MNKMRTNFGSISISYHAIASIANQAALESYGVVGLADANLAVGISRLLSKNRLPGVLVNVEDEKLVLDLYVVIEYGTRISSVTDSIASSVKYKIEKLTKIPVSKVNVHVRGLRISNID
jgi:uncharacterized alkaline shock family protein YloU